MHGIIPSLFDCWANPVFHLLAPWLYLSLQMNGRVVLHPNNLRLRVRHNFATENKLAAFRHLHVGQWKFEGRKLDRFFLGFNFFDCHLCVALRVPWNRYNF